MTHKENIKAILEYYFTGFKEEIINSACDRIVEQKPKVEEEQESKWIPISSGKLPKEGKKVLATHLGGINPDRQVIEHIYVNGRFTHGWDLDTDVNSPTFGQRYMGEIIAWMPEPEPYTTEGSDNG